MKPIVKQVRTHDLAGLRDAVAAKCGTHGTLLLGIDKDTDTGYLYAVGHANGAVHRDQGPRQGPGTFADPVYFRPCPPGRHPTLFGE